MKIETLPRIPLELSECGQLKAMFRHRNRTNEDLLAKPFAINCSSLWASRLGKIGGLYYYAIDLDFHNIAFLFEGERENNISLFEEILEYYLRESNSALTIKDIPKQITKSGGVHYVLCSSLPVKRKLKNQIMYKDIIFNFDILGINIGAPSYIHAFPTTGYIIENDCDIPMCDIFKQLCPDSLAKDIEQRYTSDADNPSLDSSDIREAIAALVRLCNENNDCPYELWYSIAVFIAFYESDDGFDLFHSFSVQVPNYTNEKSCMRTYKYALKLQPDFSVLGALRNALKKSFSHLQISQVFTILDRKILRESDRLLEEFDDLMIPKKKETFEDLCIQFMSRKGLIGEISSYLYKNLYPSYASYSVFTAFACLAAVSQYEYVFDSVAGKSATQLNLFMCLLGETAVGKENYLAFFKAFCKFFDVTPSSEASSAQGLGRLFEKNIRRDLVFAVDEFLQKAQYLKKSNRSGSEYIQVHKAIVSTLHTSSIFAGSTTRETANSIDRIEGCLMTTFGVSTPVLHSIDIEQGIANRHILVFPVGQSDNRCNVTFGVGLKQDNFFHSIRKQVKDIQTRKGKTDKANFSSFLKQNGVDLSLIPDESDPMDLIPEEIIKDKKKVDRAKKQINTFFPDTINFKKSQVNAEQSIDLYDKWKIHDFGKNNIGFHERLYLNACRFAALDALAAGESAVNRQSVDDCCNLLVSSLDDFYARLGDYRNGDLTQQTSELIDLRDKVLTFCLKAWNSGTSAIVAKTPIKRANILQNIRGVLSKNIDGVMKEVQAFDGRFHIEWTTQGQKTFFSKIIRIDD